MKNTKLRIASAICASAALFNLCAAAPASAAGSAAEKTIARLGDMDGDLSVGTKDARAALVAYVEGFVGVTDGKVTADNWTGDIDGNGKIDLRDASSILKYYTYTFTGHQPLWADFRKATYVEGKNVPAPSEPIIEYNEFGPVTIGSENGETVFMPYTLTGMYLEVGCAEGAAGETVTVPVYISGANEMAGLQMSLINDEALTPLSAAMPLPGFKENDYVFNAIEEEETTIVVFAKPENIPVTDGAVIAEVTYKIPEDAVSGTHYSINVDTEFSKFVTMDGDAFQYTLLNGIVTVK
ncbi:MAG: hypothetical protein IJL32_14795 [Oscillospiraceae bacterium]|nr:hypothetical protein [Oscillospiraceae bacterium]